MGTTNADLPEDIGPALRRAVQRIVALARPETIILFGSRAEGPAGPDSDVDLLVVADYGDRAEMTASLRREIAPILAPLSLDLLLYRPESWERARHLRGFVTREADRKGVRLYEAT